MLQKKVFTRPATRQETFHSLSEKAHHIYSDKRQWYYMQAKYMNLHTHTHTHTIAYLFDVYVDIEVN